MAIRVDNHTPSVFNAGWKSEYLGDYKKYEGIQRNSGSKMYFVVGVIPLKAGIGFVCVSLSSLVTSFLLWCILVDQVLCCYLVDKIKIEAERLLCFAQPWEKFSAKSSRNC